VSALGGLVQFSGHDLESDLRDLIEVQAQRFDAKLEQRLAETRADLIKWMFLFWLGTAGVTLVSVLAR
jgi:hypothetical protein